MNRQLFTYFLVSISIIVMHTNLWGMQRKKQRLEENDWTSCLYTPTQQEDVYTLHHKKSSSEHIPSTEVDFANLRIFFKSIDMKVLQAITNNYALPDMLYGVRAKSSEYLIIMLLYFGITNFKIFPPELSYLEEAELLYTIAQRLQLFDNGSLDLSNIKNGISDIIGLLLPVLEECLGKQITALNLSHNDLLGDLPLSIKALQNLKTLSLGDNTLNDSVLQITQHLPNLENIFLW